VVKQCYAHAMEILPPETIRSWRIAGVYTLLHAAVIYDCPEAISVSAKHIDVNVRNECGETALGIAARSGEVEAAELLLDVGADPTVANKHGETPNRC
jgi:ankyrin repeat protein